MIRLAVPGTLLYRSLVLRVVASSCKLVRCASELQEASHAPSYSAPSSSVLEAEFDAQVVSAISEAFNNIAIHGYRHSKGDVQIEISPTKGGIAVCMMDHGVTFDVTRATPKPPPNEPDQLPESGMGLFIIQSFMDEVFYSPSTSPESPNTLRLIKYFPDSGSVSDKSATSRVMGYEPANERGQERARDEK